MSDTIDLKDVSKMKVADLKKELKNRGLPVTGNKVELTERLQRAIEGVSDILDDAALADADLIDEDEVLNEVELDDDENSENDKTLDLYSAATEEALISPTIKKRPNENPLDNVPAKKIVLDRSVATLPADPVQTETEESKSAEERKVIKLTSLNEKERLEKRAEKFGVPLTAEAKKLARAARFGITGPDSKSISNNKVDTSLDVLKKRAERFGGSVSKTLVSEEIKEKLEKRKARFGNVQDSNITTTSTAQKSNTTNGLSNEEKAKLRLERFKTQVK